MLPMPEDLMGEVRKVGNEVVYIGLLLSADSYDMDDVLADLKALARRLESLNMARFMSDISHERAGMRN